MAFDSLACFLTCQEGGEGSPASRGHDADKKWGACAHCSVTYSSQGVEAASEWGRLSEWESRKKGRKSHLLQPWVGLEGIMRSDISQSGKDKHHVWTLMTKMN